MTNRRFVIVFAVLIVVLVAFSLTRALTGGGPP